MSSFMLFKIENTLFTLEDTESNALDLESIVQKMNEVPTTIDEDNRVNSAGFHNISIESYIVPEFEFQQDETTSEEEEILYKPVQLTVETPKSIGLISAEVTGRGSLGNYQQAYMDKGVLTAINAQQSFYTHASIRILENGLLLIFFRTTASEKIKGQIVSLFEEELELELEQVRVSPTLLLKVRQYTDWQNIRIDQIRKVGDKTKSVNYAIDVADESPAVIHDMYKNQGKMVQLTSVIPYTPNNKSLQAGVFTINLYQVQHRFSLLDVQFENDLSELKSFALYFSSLLLAILEHTN